MGLFTQQELEWIDKNEELIEQGEAGLNELLRKIAIDLNDHNGNDFAIRRLIILCVVNLKGFEGFENVISIKKTRSRTLHNSGCEHIVYHFRIKDLPNNLNWLSDVISFKGNLNRERFKSLLLPKLEAFTKKIIFNGADYSSCKQFYDKLMKFIVDDPVWDQNGLK